MWRTFGLEWTVMASLDFTRDETWGWVLIALGIILLIWKPGNKFNAWLNGQGNTMVTFLLLMSAVVYILIALFAKPEFKVVALAWAVTP